MMLQTIDLYVVVFVCLSCIELILYPFYDDRNGVSDDKNFVLDIYFCLAKKRWPTVNQIHNLLHNLLRGAICIENPVISGPRDPPIQILYI